MNVLEMDSLVKDMRTEHTAFYNEMTARIEKLRAENAAFAKWQAEQRRKAAKPEPAAAPELVAEPVPPDIAAARELVAAMYGTADNRKVSEKWRNRRR